MGKPAENECSLQYWKPVTTAWSWTCREDARAPMPAPVCACPSHVDTWGLGTRWRWLFFISSLAPSGPWGGMRGEASGSCVGWRPHHGDSPPRREAGRPASELLSLSFIWEDWEKEFLLLILTVSEGLCQEPSGCFSESTKKGGVCVRSRTKGSPVKPWAYSVVCLVCSSLLILFFLTW